MGGCQKIRKIALRNLGTRSSSEFLCWYLLTQAGLSSRRIPQYTFHCFSPIKEAWTSWSLQSRSYDGLPKLFKLMMMKIILVKSKPPCLINSYIFSTIFGSYENRNVILAESWHRRHGGASKWPRDLLLLSRKCCKKEKLNDLSYPFCLCFICSNKGYLWAEWSHGKRGRRWSPSFVAILL